MARYLEPVRLGSFCPCRSARRPVNVKVVDVVDVADVADVPEARGSLFGLLFTGAPLGRGSWLSGIEGRGYSEISLLRSLKYKGMRERGDASSSSLNDMASLLNSTVRASRPRYGERLSSGTEDDNGETTVFSKS